MKRKPFTPGVRRFLGWFRAIVEAKGWVFAVRGTPGVLRRFPLVRGSKGGLPRRGSRGGDVYCPVCAVATEKGVNPDNRTVSFGGLGTALGITEEDAYDIAAAADQDVFTGENAPYRRRLRKSLLKAAKISS